MNVSGDLINRVFNLAEDSGTIINNSYFNIESGGTVRNDSALFINNFYGIIKNNENSNNITFVSNKYGGIIETFNSHFTKFRENNGIYFNYYNPVKAGLRRNVDASYDTAIAALPSTLSNKDDIEEWYYSWWVANYLGKKRQVIQRRLTSYELREPITRILYDDFLDEYEINLYTNYFKKSIKSKYARGIMFKVMLTKEPFISPPKSDFIDRVKNFLDMRKVISTTDFNIIISSS